VKEVELRSSPVDPFALDAYLKWKGVSRVDWQWRAFDFAVTGHYLDGFHELDKAGREHWVKQTWVFDLQASYSFRNFGPHDAGIPGLTKNVEDAKASHSPGKDQPTTLSCARSVLDRLLSNTIITIGCRNIFDEDPPHAITNFPRFIYDPTGRFVYGSLTKRF